MNIESDYGEKSARSIDNGRRIQIPDIRVEKRTRFMRNIIKKFVSGVLLLSLSFTYNANRLDVAATSSKQETDAATDENQISREMNNSIAMLNYLTVVNQEINDSSNSRLFLEEVYSSLINNTSPNAVDDRTQVQLGDMLDTIDQYRMIDVKRDRLLYIYEQNKAQALRDAVPNPLGLLSSVRSFSLPQLLFSVTYMAIDAKASYDTSMAHAEMEYLQDGWELDDAAMKALSVSRENLFDYMIDMVQDKKIPDDYALTEDAVKRFVKCKNNTNVSRRIQFLESNKSTYERFGDYWLVLAESYHANGDYEKCLEAVKEYEDIQAKIFRKDHELANTMPLAIVAAEESITNEKECNNGIKHYVELLTKNIDTEDWALRYFAAQTYLDLYNRTKDKSNIDKAYSLTLDNVNYLIDEQKSQNNVYLAEIKKKAEPKGATKEVKKEIKDYNKMLEQERKTKLAPIYEPLRLNCDLLFALANELNISENEQKKIERILHGSSRKDSLFLNETLDNKYYFDKQEAAKDNITLEKGVLTVPVSMVSDETTITVVIGDGTSATTADDWKLKKVERKKSGDITTFEAQYTSKKADDATYNDGTKVSLEINAIEDEECKPISATFKTVKTKKLMITDYRFVRTDQ